MVTKATIGSSINYGIAATGSYRESDSLRDAPPPLCGGPPSPRRKHTKSILPIITNFPEKVNRMFSQKAGKIKVPPAGF